MSALSTNPPTIVDYPEFRAKLTDPSAPSTFLISVPGASCSRCIQKIEGGLRQLPEVASARVDLGEKLLEITLSSPEAALTPAIETLHSLGFEALPVPPVARDRVHAKTRRRELMELGVAAACSGNIMLLSVAQYAGAAASEFDWLFGVLSFGLFLPVAIFSAQSFFRNVWAALSARRPHIDLAVILAILVGSGFSAWNLLQGSGETYFDSISTLVFLLLSARRFLSELQARHRRQLKNLSSISMEAVEVEISPDRWSLLPPSALQLGQTIRVAPGQTIPADGRLLDSQRQVSLAMLSGESEPIVVSRGELVYAGAENGGESLRMVVSAINDDTRVGRILKDLEGAQSRRSAMVGLTDRVGQWFTVSVLALGSAFAALYWSTDPVEAFQRALALTLLACPCALALATPLAQGLAIVRLARRGIILKSAETLERILKIQNILFDKTGTLTAGQLDLGQVLGPLSSDEKAIILGLEKDSLHPVARSLRNQWPEVTPAEIHNTRETPGLGVEGSLNGNFYRLASCPPPEVNLGAKTGTWVGFYVNGKLQACLEFLDRIRPEASAVLKIFRERSIECRLVSGDNLDNAKSVGTLLDFSTSHIHAEKTPEAKAELARELSPSAVVGDGINDALAMASADVGVAVHGGIESCLRAADVFLAKQDLRGLLDLFDVAQETHRLIVRNLSFSLVYNVTGATLALMGHIHPLVAAILMPASSITLTLSVMWGTRQLRRGEVTV